MSGKEFFVKRYEKLGWKFKEVELKQAIRINTMNVKEENIVERLQSSGIELEKRKRANSSFILLKIIVERKANKIIVDRKSY